MTSKKDTAKENNQDCSPKYSIKQLIAGVFAVLSLVGGAGYSVGAGVAKVDTQQQENVPPQEVVHADSVKSIAGELADIRRLLERHADTLSEISKSQYRMAIRVEYMEEDLDSASSRVHRLTRAMDRLSDKYNLGFACDNMASGPVASVKKGEM